MNDVTELAKLRAHIAALELQLTAHEQLQELLLYTTSHDLRTPVMTVLGFTDMLLADIQDSTNNQTGNQHNRQYLERIRGAAQRQILLIEDLQRVSHLNRQPLQSSNTDLSAVAQHCLQTLSDAASSATLALQIEATPLTHCDPKLMTVALQALLSNAMKLASSTTKPQITFGAEIHHDRTIFYVRDNGVGFDLGPDKTLLNFYRHLQANNEYAGAGMALLTAVVIIQRHHGNLWIESGMGTGTCVYFSMGN